MRLSPSGTVVVFTGILPVAKDEQGLAAILGHGMFHCSHAILNVPLSRLKR
jgi:Zn-dependent protease with chaperone function